MKVIARGRVLELPDGQRVRLEAEASQVLEIGDVVIVRLHVQPGAIKNENVVAFDRKNAELLWRIPVRKYVYADSPYTAISREGEYIWAHNWDGADVKLDTRTGEILEEKFSK